MMGLRGFKTKREFKEWAAEPRNQVTGKSERTVEELRRRIVETSMFGPEFKDEGINNFVGPCAHTKRDWYLNVTCEGGVITKVT